MAASSRGGEIRQRLITYLKQQSVNSTANDPNSSASEARPASETFNHSSSVETVKEHLPWARRPNLSQYFKNVLRNIQGTRYHIFVKETNSSEPMRYDTPKESHNEIIMAQPLIQGRNTSVTESLGNPYASVTTKYLSSYATFTKFFSRNMTHLLEESTNVLRSFHIANHSDVQNLNRSKQITSSVQNLESTDTVMRMSTNETNFHYDVNNKNNMQSSSEESDYQKMLATLWPWYRSKNKSENKKVYQPSWMVEKRHIVSKASIDSRTKYLVRGIPGDSDRMALRRLCDLCQHLETYPQSKGAAVKVGAVGRMLRLIATTKDTSVKRQARYALVLLGYSGTLPRRGIRVLSIDGGGVRGLVALTMLKRLEDLSGHRIYELFDLICGVSTGAIVSTLVGARRLPVTECLQLYVEMSKKIFEQSMLRGATGIIKNMEYYNSEFFEKLLQDNMGMTPLLETAVDEGSPKLCLVATITTNGLAKSFLFRNFVSPYREASQYAGTSDARLWQAVRASAAAPFYFKEFIFQDKVLSDGGLLVNNPTAIAIHEARRIWPRHEFQCVVSLGTGRCLPFLEASSSKSSLLDTARSVIYSATDTEGVHTVLHDLLPGNVYFRFNPHMSEEIGLSEVRPDKITSLLSDVHLYIRQNSYNFEEAAGALTRHKSIFHKAKDSFYVNKLIYGFDAE